MLGKAVITAGVSKVTVVVSVLEVVEEEKRGRQIVSKLLVILA